MAGLDPAIHVLGWRRRGRGGRLLRPARRHAALPPRPAPVGGGGGNLAPAPPLWGRPTNMRTLPPPPFATPTTSAAPRAPPASPRPLRPETRLVFAEVL